MVDAFHDKSDPIRAPVISEADQPRRESRSEVIEEITACTCRLIISSRSRIFDTSRCSCDLFARPKSCSPFQVSELHFKESQVGVHLLRFTLEPPRL